MKNFKKIILIAGIVLCVSVVIIALQKNPTTPLNQATGRVRITTTFYPLAEFARAVGGAYVDVTSLTPPGAEPHEYEPTAQNLVAIQNSQLFIMNGSGLDTWGERVEKSVTSRGGIVLNMADDVTRIQLTTSASEETNNQTWDPHYWLNPVIASKEVEVIAASLIAIDPNHKDQYTTNAKKYIEKLSQLDQEYQDGLKTCASRTIVTTHNAFSYLAKQYNIQTIAIAGLSPNAEPSPQHLIAISKTMEANHIGYIFFETLASPRLAEIIAKETGAKTLVFNPIEGLTQSELAQSKDYLAIMQDNLHNLRIALSCQ